MAAGMADVGPPAGSYACFESAMRCTRSHGRRWEAYDGGVKPCTGKSTVCTGKSLLCCESSCEVGLSAIVHALDGGGHGADGGRKGEEVAVVHDELR